MEVRDFFSTPVSSFRPVHGGDINQAFYVESEEGKFFLKLNDAVRFPDMLEKEAGGLKALSGSSLKIPAVINHGIIERKQFLILEWLEAGAAGKTSWELFGRGLANLHRRESSFFGWEEDNYIGSLPQVNTPARRWSVFYAEHRIMPLVKKLFDNGSFDQANISSAERLCSQLEKIFPEEPPALIHGDLWSGNFLITKEGLPAVYDPAVYYGHREMDLGMSMLFGGFDADFYRSYDEVYPLESSWKERIPLTQLYPLLVHAILFGGGYIQRCRSILQAF
jgi:fructosamine-3-kinase